LPQPPTFPSASTGERGYYELGVVPANQLDVVLATSKIVRQSNTLRQLDNVAVLFTPPGDSTASEKNNDDTVAEDGAASKQQQLVAWAYLGIDMGLNTLYVLPEHRGKGLAKIAAAKLLAALCDGTAGSQKVQCDWCIADVAADNGPSQGVCKALRAKLLGRSAYMRIDLDEVN
jgi:GNAT superfamily N-acetyltransferase